MYLSVAYNAHRRDNYFTEPFLQILEENKFLLQLSEATLFDPYALDAKFSPRHLSLCVRGMESLFLQPCIVKLNLFNLHCSCMPAIPNEIPSGRSNITHRTIMCGGRPRELPLGNPSLKAYLQLPKALISLALYMQSHWDMGGGSGLC